MSVLNAPVVEVDGTMVFHLTGDVDAWLAAQACDEARGALLSHPLAVDLTDVTFIEREAVAELIRLSRSLMGAGRPRLELRNVPWGIVRRMGALKCAFRLAAALP